jgi:hypothetical protein
MLKLKTVKVSDLSIHPSYAKIYQVNNHQREILKDSIILTGGLLEPIVINEQNEIIHGVQRYLVYQELQWEEIPATLFGKVKSDDDVFYIISFNRHRDKSMLERWNEIKTLKAYWLKKQGERTDLQENLTEFDKLSTRAKLALHCNIAEGNVYKIEKIGLSEESEHFLNLISKGEMSLHEAYTIVTKKDKNNKPQIDESNGKAMDMIYNFCCPKCKHEFNN